MSAAPSLLPLRSPTSHQPRSPSRLTELEQLLAHSTPGKEGYSFKTNMLEAFVFSITAGSFRGLNLSSSMVGTAVPFPRSAPASASTHNLPVRDVSGPLPLRAQEVPRQFCSTSCTAEATLPCPALPSPQPSSPLCKMQLVLEAGPGSAPGDAQGVPTEV